MSVDGIREHMANLQAIADANGGSRLAGASGHDASAAYVKERLEAAGYDASYQEFTYNYTGPRTAPVLSVVGGPSYASGFQFQASTSLTPADNVDVTRPLVAVDLKIPSTGGSTSGCEPGDFTGFPAGAIALVQRGTCDFVVKIQNAIKAGASAVVIMNEGNAPDRMGLLNPATGRRHHRAGHHVRGRPGAGQRCHQRPDRSHGARADGHHLRAGPPDPQRDRPDLRA